MTYQVEKLQALNTFSIEGYNGMQLIAGNDYFFYIHEDENIRAVIEDDGFIFCYKTEQQAKDLYFRDYNAVVNGEGEMSDECICLWGYEFDKVFTKALTRE